MPDISKLPLMPGDDTLRPEDRSPAPQASVAPAEVAVLSDWNEVSACDCPVCREVRASRAAQAIPPVPATQPGDWPILIQEDATTPRIARAANWLSAAYASAAYASAAGFSTAEPPTTTRIRGRYTQDRDANTSMAGRERWLEPSTGVLYDTVSGRFASNSGLSQQGDGTWVSTSGMVWEVL